MGRLPPELTSGGYLFPAFLSPGFPSREAMKLRKLSFVNTNFRTRSVHFKAVFIAVSRFKCSLAKVRSNGIATTAMCGCVRMSVFFVRFCHPLRWKASAQSGAYSVEASKQGHCLSHYCGSMTPLPFRSGLRSRWPQTVLLGYKTSNCRMRKRSASRCCGVRVSAAAPSGCRPPS